MVSNSTGSTQHPEVDHEKHIICIHYPNLLGPRPVLFLNNADIRENNKRTDILRTSLNPHRKSPLRPGRSQQNQAAHELIPCPFPDSVLHGVLRGQGQRPYPNVRAHLKNHDPTGTTQKSSKHLSFVCRFKAQYCFCMPRDFEASFRDHLLRVCFECTTQLLSRPLKRQHALA